MTNNPKNRQKWIFDLLKVEGLGYGECFSKYSVKFSRTERTFNKDWKKASTLISEYQKIVSKAKDDVSIANEIEVLKSGLKTKNQRLLFYQNQIDIMEKQLTGETKIYFIINNKPVVNPNSKGEYILPLEKQNEIRKQIKDYQTEISKIEGDYAATKNDHTTKGESINIISLGSGIISKDETTS
jgi:hypothetical protein